MKILQVNTVYGKGSTGKIALGIHDVCIQKNIQCLTAYRYVENKAVSYVDTDVVSSWLDCHIHNRLVRYTLLQGMFSRFKTITFLRRVKKYSPDLIHLHNLHGNYINLKLLFRYIKKNNIPVFWTLHDCWAFTGQCPHFTMAKCDKWREGCHTCQQYKSIGNPVKNMYRLKQSLFTGLEDMTIVTPSQWLANLVKQSYLKEYPIQVINNGIDLEVFKPTPSEFRKSYKIPESKYIILGVAFGWGISKGLDVFVELSRRLGREKYQIVLVGTNENVDKQLSEDIISIRCTNNQQELAEIYTVADLFVNPTREDTYPTVNVEALACGTPVITFKTGGSPEMISSTCGCVVECDDTKSLCEKIEWICTERPFSHEACVAHVKQFEQKDKFMQYVELYKQVFDGEK